MPSAAEVVTLKNVCGETVHVLKADLLGSRPLLRMRNADGSRIEHALTYEPNLIHRESLVLAEPFDRERFIEYVGAFSYVPQEDAVSYARARYTDESDYAELAVSVIQQGMAHPAHKKN